MRSLTTLPHPADPGATASPERGMTHPSSDIDPLSHLSTRRGIERSFDQRLAIARSVGGPLAVLIVRIENLRRISDVAGAHVADEVLAEVADVIEANLTDGSATAGCYSSDEYAIVLSGIDALHADRVAARITRDLSRLHLARAPRLDIVVGGATGIPRFMQRPEALFEVAGQAVDAAAETGRPAYVARCVPRRVALRAEQRSHDAPAPQPLLELGA